MKLRTGTLSLIAVVAVVVLSATPTLAVDVEKKWRISLAAGGMNGQDEVDSNAANVLRLVDEDLQTVERYIDPRDDTSTFGALDLQPGPIATVAVQYALTKMFVLEASVAYHKTDLGDVELQAQFDRVPITQEIGFNFESIRIDAGELERVPIQLAAIARFRPRASFNPYVGAGLGYSIVGFEPSNDFDALSEQMDRSRGGLARLTGSFFGNPSLINPPSTQFEDLEGATVNARDTWEYFLTLGGEYSFKKRWAAFVDVRYTFSARTIDIGFNGGDELGVSVPRLSDFFFTEVGTETYGAIRIDNGGLIDGGQLIPSITSDPMTDCSMSVNLPDCTFVSNDEALAAGYAVDNEVDPGFYYVQGGSVSYDALTVQAGIRFTF